MNPQRFKIIHGTLATLTPTLVSCKSHVIALWLLLSFLFFLSFLSFFPYHLYRCLVPNGAFES